MKNTEQDKFDELFRNKLYDFEAFPDESDWARIDRRLPGRKSVAFVQLRRYVAAAVLLSFVAAAGFYFMSQKKNFTEKMQAEVSGPSLPAADSVRPDREEQPAPSLLASASENQSAGAIQPAGTEQIQTHTEEVTRLPEVVTDEPVSDRDYPSAGSVRPPVLAAQSGEVVAPAARKAAESSARAVAPTGVPVEAEPAAADDKVICSLPVADPEPVVSARSARSKGWSFGAGSGAFTAGASNSLPAVAGMAFCNAEGVNSPLVKSEQALMNAITTTTQRSLRTDIKHHTPVSFGMSVSKRLNDRFSLQSGLVYTYLSSEWKTGGALNGKARQKLHYLGIPLSVRYKIAEWSDFQLYASAGAMGEINVAGKTQMQVFDYEDKAIEDSEKTRMKEVLWSVRGNIGVSYPVVRFLHVFAETGAAYYFDNGSDIETIRSEKPFNVDFHLGFRFGF